MPNKRFIESFAELYDAAWALDFDGTVSETKQGLWMMDRDMLCAREKEAILTHALALNGVELDRLERMVYDVEQNLAAVKPAV